MGRPPGSKNKTVPIKITNLTSNEVDKKKLLAFVERIERLEADKAEIASDIASVYEEVAESEFDKKIVRACVRLRKKSKSEREAEAEIIDLYMAALGDFATTELGQASKPSPIHAVRFET
jgi:uncharacterized protein (UPF0335 family)